MCITQVQVCEWSLHHFDVEKEGMFDNTKILFIPRGLLFKLSDLYVPVSEVKFII